MIVRLAAFAESNKVDDKDPILIEVGPYSLQYDFARDDEVLKNHVTIAHLEDQGIIVQGGGLVPHENIFSEADFGGSGKTLRIEACGEIPGTLTAPSTMSVGIALGDMFSPCSVMDDPSTTATTDATTTTVKPDTTITTTPSTTTTTPATKPKCPDTGNLRFSFVKNGKVKTKACNIIDKRDKFRQYCSQWNHSNDVFAGHHLVSDICQAECAFETDACTRD